MNIPIFCQQERLSIHSSRRSFNGGYLAACLEGAGEAERLLAGHQLAMRVVGANGAIIPR